MILSRMKLRGGVSGYLKYASCGVFICLYQKCNDSNFLYIALLLVSVGFASDVAVRLLLLFLFYALFCNLI